MKQRKWEAVTTKLRYPLPTKVKTMYCFSVFTNLGPSNLFHFFLIEVFGAPNVQTNSKFGLMMIVYKKIWACARKHSLVSVIFCFKSYSTPGRHVKSQKNYLRHNINIWSNNKSDLKPSPNYERPWCRGRIYIIEMDINILRVQQIFSQMVLCMNDIGKLRLSWWLSRFKFESGQRPSSTIMCNLLEISRNRNH